MTLALTCLIVGFLLAIGGLWMWSHPAALLVAGIILFVSGGLELRGQPTRRRE